jgi:hypothetical protein
MDRRIGKLLAAAWLAFTATSVVAQPNKYSAPGRLGIDPGRDRDRLEQTLEDALWTFGRLRVDPWIGLREVAWVEPADRDGDLTASIGAGVRAYLPVGSKSTFAAHVLPTYIWWQDRDDDRRLGGNYGLGYFYFTDRASVEISARKSDLDDFVTDEVDRRGAVDAITYRVNVEVPFSARLGMFVHAGRYDQKIDDTLGGDGDLEDLSSHTDSIEGGLTWLLGSTLRFRAGVGTVETVFDDSARDRGNEGEYWLVGVGWRRSRLSADVAYRSGTLKATEGSEFVEFDDATWQARVTWRVRPRTSLSVYGQNALQYSVREGLASYVDERAGARVAFPILRDVGGSLFYEDGRRTYDLGAREDDVTSWGGQIAMPLWRKLQLSVTGRTTSTDSPFGSTEYSEYRFGVSFGTSATLGSDGGGFY